MTVDRRTWLQGGLGVAIGGALGSGPPSTSAAVEPIVVPTDLEIIDCHTHFYDPTRPEGVPWPGKGTPLYRTVLPQHLREQKQFRRVTGTVVVEASPRVEDNAWLLQLAANDPFIVGVVGHLDPGQAEFAQILARFAANPLFRGIRVSSRLLKDPIAKEVLNDLKLLADRGLALDVNGGPESFAAVASLAPQLPELRIVQNHISNVRITADSPPQLWLDNMQAAARHANVFCKVSALVEGAAPQGQKAPTDLEFYRPYLDAVWKAFGDDRLIYGSNWPVSERAADYFTLQRLALEYVAEKGPAVLAKFCSQNAKTAYR